MNARSRSQRALVLGLAALVSACGSDSSPTSATKANTPPGNVVLSVSPATNPLIGVPVTFTASAVDAEGDALSYAWNFGDGSTGSGATTTHVYTTSGLNTVTVTVTDGKGGSASATGTVRLMTVAGNWIQPEDFPIFGYALQQNGVNISGDRIDRRNGAKQEPCDISGTVLDHRRVRFECFYTKTRETDTITGTLDASVTLMAYSLQDGRASTLTKE